eukprot:CAMPEP_0118644834 /NCGR_PEP_ID=MMETSP0785-20121206/7163_1 /TAXON_ID=91992 /ORGANISM="Bolidomonas pacifica, Strain CCMP 1866" /LENGTH=198 /DNA_ID=CAMNT_0006536645 /DNA_START=125 /DNA_END=717 /DNA_ORIENTATION=-
MFSQSLPPGVTTAIKVSGRLRVQTTYDGSGVEMVEEWGSDVNLLSRRWRERGMMGKEGEWEWEIGTPAVKNDGNGNGGGSGGVIKASDVNPVWIGKDSTAQFVYCLTKCPWKVENYTVTYDEDKDEFVLRTKNRKFYKRWRVPGLVRLGIKGEGLEVQVEHKGDGEDVLLIKIEKPERVREEERRRRDERMTAAKNAG